MLRIQLTFRIRRQHQTGLKFTDKELERTAVATLSPRFNPCSLEYHWHYLVYRNLFNVLEEIEFPYTAFLAPQFAVSARSPIAASIQPTVDYAIVVTLPPKDVAIPGWAWDSDGCPMPCEIISPSLSVGEVIVPVIIEIKTSNSDNSSDIYRALIATNDQLLERAAFLFSDFEWQQEVIAIACVGSNWWWFRIPRPSPAHSSQDSGNKHSQGNAPSSNAVDSSSDHPLNATNSHATDIPKPTLPDSPFVIGTTRSTEAVLEVKALVNEIAYRDLRTTLEAIDDDDDDDDDDNVAKPCELLSASSDVVAMDSEVDKETGSGVSTSGSDGKSSGPGPDGDTQGR